MAPGVVTASQFEEESILTGTPSRYATHSRDTSGSEEVSGSDDVSGSEEASAPATSSQSSSSDEADSVDSTPTPQIGVPALIADQPNRWCVEGQFKVYSDAKLSNDKGVRIDGL